MKKKFIRIKKRHFFFVAWSLNPALVRRMIVQDVSNDKSLLNFHDS